MSELPNLDIEFLKLEVNRIDKMLMDNVSSELIRKRFSKFAETFPILMDNILSKKMSKSEVIVLLETFSKAQDTYINNVKFK